MVEKEARVEFDDGLKLAEDDGDTAEARIRKIIEGLKASNQ